MSVQQEAKAVEAAVENEVIEVKQEVEKVSEKVKDTFVQIVADEKLYLREAELEFLKAQVEIQRLNRIAETKSKAYTDFIEQLFTKYGLTKVEYIFDGAVAQFKKL
jgi:hypothetical protein